MMDKKKNIFVGPILLSTDDDLLNGFDIGEDTDNGGKTGQHGE